MADIKKGDTWPPLRGRAEDENGLIPLVDADQVLIFMRLTSAPNTLLSGTVVPFGTPDADGFNWQYTWKANDTAVVGTYDTELQVTWDNVSTPNKVESIPNNKANNPQVVIWEDVD